MQIGVARNPPLEHAFARLLGYLAHNSRRSRVERRSTDPIERSDEVATFGRVCLASAVVPVDSIPPMKKPRFPTRKTSDTRTDFFFKPWSANGKELAGPDLPIGPTLKIQAQGPTSISSARDLVTEPFANPNALATGSFQP